MSKLVWVADLDTGIAEIDRQHRRIVDYINQLGQLRHTHDREGIGEVIADLVDYTLSHFVFEENLIENAGYMFSGPHKKVHEIFTRRVSALQTRFEMGDDVAEELHGMLSRWLFNHIRHEDHGYVDAVKAYLRALQRNNPAAERERIRAEVEREIKQKMKPQRRGWMARLFGGD